MTTRTNGGLSNVERLRRTHPANIAYPVLNTELVGVSDLLKATAQRYLPGYPISLGYTEHQPILADNSVKTVFLCYLAHTDLQSVKESGSTNSISFPPFYYWEQEVSPAPNIFM
jgi:hypothetical protein